MQKIGIIGLGLIGGSLAKLIREKSPSTVCVATDSDLHTLEQAKDEGIIHSFSKDYIDFPKDLEVIFVCTPIDITRTILLDLSALLPSSCILSDVASVKEAILNNIACENIVGGHPIAGTEFSGYNASSASIMYNAPYIIVPNTQNSDACQRLQQFLLFLGFRVALLSAEDHDKFIASTSHLPYLMASLTASYASDIHPHPLLFGPGFASTTRVAKSNPDWGVAICKTNKDALLHGLHSIQAKAQQLESWINTNDWDSLKTFLEETQQGL